MSYHIYTTPGIVLKRKTFGEANTLLYILTRDFGLIIASAKSTRHQKSKLRGFLEEYSEISVSLIKGKNGWKVTNASESGNLYFELPDYARKSLANVSLMLIKMIQGEAPQKEVFDLVQSGLWALRSVPEEEILDLEALIILRIMKELGYVVLSENVKSLANDNNSWDEEALSMVKKNKLEVVSLINNAIKESQL